MTQILRTFSPNANENKQVFEAVNWILSTWTSLKYRSVVERLLITRFVPHHFQAHDRMKRLLELFCIIDDYALQAFVDLQKSQKLMRDTVCNWFNLLNAIEITPKIHEKLMKLAETISK